jgi:ribosomal protein L13
MGRLRIFNGQNHCHTAQTPIEFNISNIESSK